MGGAGPGPCAELGSGHWASIGVSLYPTKEEPSSPVGSHPNLQFLILGRGKPSEPHSDRTFTAHIPTYPKTFSTGPHGTIPGHTVE